MSEQVAHIPKGGAYVDHGRTDTTATEQAAPGSSAQQLAEVRGRWSDIAEPPAQGGSESVTGELLAAEDQPYLTVDLKLADYDKGENPSGVEINIQTSGGVGTAAAELAADAYDLLTARLTQEHPAGSGDNADD